jgi:2-dehydropantoate 2-reductase
MRSLPAGRRLRVAVIGAGAVGGVFSACLAQAGHVVSVADVRPDLLEAFRLDGIKIRGAREVDAHFARVCTDTEILVEKRHDLVLLALKVPAMPSAAALLREHDDGRAICVVACNGLGAEDAVCQAVGRKRVHRLVLNFAASIETPGVVHLRSFMGDFVIGPCDPSGMALSERLARIFSEAGLPTSAVADIVTRQWEKLILNAALSAVCAVTGLTTSDVMQHAEGRELACRTIAEGVAVASACGVKLAEGFFDHSVAYLDRCGSHVPSLARDLTEGRPVEIDALNGAIVEAGKRAGVATPVNEALSVMVRMMRDCKRQQAV